jgi:hypothetical protein
MSYWGAPGNNQSGDTAALVAAINSGQSFEVENGRFLITANAAPRMNTSQHIFGSGRPPQGFGGTAGSGLQRVGSGLLLNFSGTSNNLGSGGSNDRCSFAGLNNIGLFGDGSSTGHLLNCNYADNLVLDNVMLYGNPDTSLEMIELWDTDVKNLHMFWCGGYGTFQQGACVHISGSTFGSANRINFWGFRCETFKGHSLFLDDGGVAINAPYQINFYAPKFESTLRRGLAFVTAKNTVSTISFRDAYFASDALDSGGSAGPVVDVVGATNWLFDNVRFYIAGSSATCCFNVWSSGYNDFRHISANDATTLSAGVFFFSSGGTAVETSSYLRGSQITGSSVLYTGALPTGFTIKP